MSYLEIRKGDLFSYHGNIAHGVNCVGAMGKGIAIQFKALFPEMYERYRIICKDGRLIPGMVFSWKDQAFVPYYNDKGQLSEKEDEVATRFIYNLAIKAHWRLPASYPAVEATVNKMAAHIVEQMPHKREVGMPWVGCGLGSLSKGKVKKILEGAANKHEVKFVVYEL